MVIQYLIFLYFASFAQISWILGGLYSVVGRRGGSHNATMPSFKVAEDMSRTNMLATPELDAKHEASAPLACLSQETQGALKVRDFQKALETTTATKRRKI